MKEKSIKFRISEASSDRLEQVASETGTTKSEVIRNGIPKKISSKIFNDLLSFHNLVHLENEAEKCVSSFENGIAIELNEISNQYPAYVIEESGSHYLQVKFPTLQLNLNEIIEQENLRRILSNYSSIEIYSDKVFINMVMGWRESVLCLDNDLNSNYELAESISTELLREGLSVTSKPHYYIKSYKLKTDSARQYAIGIVK